MLELLVCLFKIYKKNLFILNFFKKCQKIVCNFMFVVMVYVNQVRFYLLSFFIRDVFLYGIYFYLGWGAGYKFERRVEVEIGFGSGFVR